MFSLSLTLSILVYCGSYQLLPTCHEICKRLNSDAGVEYYGVGRNCLVLPVSSDLVENEDSIDESIKPILVFERKFFHGNIYVYLINSFPNYLLFWQTFRLSFILST